MQNQLDKEIERAETAEANEEAARKAADQNIVDWAKSHFMDTLVTIGHAPLTLTVSYYYDSDGYKVYEIDGTVDCYSKGEINELVDNLQQADSLLQSNIDNV
ncbi:MAG: hypothetical protein LUC37_02010 [Prevotella sp.]|nr:hypothetical protein [Prevotella sp.]